MPVKARAARLQVDAHIDACRIYAKRPTRGRAFPSAQDTYAVILVCARPSDRPLQGF